MVLALSVFVIMLVKIQKLFPTGPARKILLNKGFVALCDPKWLYALSALHWYAKKSRGLYYACAKVKIDGKIRFLRMHRIVAHTPADKVTHHINGNTLDNRVANLQNLTKFEHAKYYSYW